MTLYGIPQSNQLSGSVFTLSVEHNPNYLPRLVVAERFKPMTRANKLQIAVLNGYDVILSKDVKKGDVLLYFPLGAAIEPSFLAANNLFDWDNRELNANFKEVTDLLLGGPAATECSGTTGSVRDKAKSMCGMFNAKGVVKAKRVRGELSQGFAMDARQALEAWLPGTEFPDLAAIAESHVDFDTVAGRKLAWKYAPIEKGPKYTPSLLTPAEKRQKRRDLRDNRLRSLPRMVEGQFHFHIDTLMLNEHIGDLTPDMDINISTKYHGTSCISAHVLTRRKLRWWEKAAKSVGIRVRGELEYGHIYSSRSVVKNGEFNPKKGEDYYVTDVWSEADKKIREFVAPGETWYYEIIGYLPGTDELIMDGYDYKCAPGEFKMKLYRVTKTDQDGNVAEVPMDHYERLCAKTGYAITPVNTLYEGKAGKLYPEFDITKRYVELKQELIKAFNVGEDLARIQEPLAELLDVWRGKWLDKLKADKRFFMELDSPDCANHVPHEGVVVRVTKPSTPLLVYKLKCNRFYERESKMNEEGKTDLESVS